MEVLGFEETPESQFCDQPFIKSQHPGFVDLLDGNKFLGIGGNYLWSDQIVKVRPIAYHHLYLSQTQKTTSPLCSPLWSSFHQDFEKSILLKDELVQFPENPTWASCFCGNSCMLAEVTSFLLLINFQLYFIFHGTGSFESDPEGDEEYQLFFANRLEEICSLGPVSTRHIFDFLEEEVIGVERKQTSAEQKRQKEFSDAQLQEVGVQAAKEDAEELGTTDEQGGGDQENEAAGEN